MFARAILTTASAALIALVPVCAGGRQRVLAVSAPREALAITFIDAGASVVDAGTFVWRGGSKRSVVTTRRVSMRIGEPSAESRGTATVRAYLETADPYATIRIDGVTLTNAPRIIQSNAPIGIAFAHRLEIEVPVTAPEGPLQASIAWEVTTD
jgi:hypothetical protein